jgi:hypothetical protein
LKLGITVLATVILLIYIGTFREMAGVAADPVVHLAAVRNASPIVHAILALVLLVAATVLVECAIVGTDPGAVRVQAPPDGNIAPAGHYLLVILTAGGAPSLGRWIRLT